MCWSAAQWPCRSFAGCTLDALLEAASIAAEPNVHEGVGWLEREIRQQRNLVAESMREDTFRPFTNEDFDAGIQQLLDFAQFRPAFVRDQVARLAP